MSPNSDVSLRILQASPNVEKRTFGAAGAIAAALGGLSPATAPLNRIADFAEATAIMPRLPALCLAFAILAGISLGALAYARP